MDAMEPEEKQLMARPPTLGPAWLVGLLAQWGKREANSMSLGFYKINPMLKDGIATSQRSSHEPTGYSAVDFDQLEKAIEGLPKAQCLAIVRYAKPWKATLIDMEYPIHQRTWLDHLKAGLISLEISLDAQKTYFRVAVF
jgi:hypothetical protein